MVSGYIPVLGCQDHHGNQHWDERARLHIHLQAVSNACFRGSGETAYHIIGPHHFGVKTWRSDSRSWSSMPGRTNLTASAIESGWQKLLDSSHHPKIQQGSRSPAGNRDVKLRA